jgi:hypothetical protein
MFTWRAFRARSARALAIGAALFGGAACGDSTTSPAASYHVTYTLEGIDISVGIDSIKYDNGTGTLVAAAHPDVTWSQTETVPSGGSVQLSGWFDATMPITVRMIEQWTLSGASTHADTALAVVSALGRF